MEFKDYLQLAAAAITVIVPVSAIIVFFIKREINRLDALPLALNKLSEAISRLSIWKSAFVAENRNTIRGIKHRVTRLEQRQEALEAQLCNQKENE